MLISRNNISISRTKCMTCTRTGPLKCPFSLGIFKKTKELQLPLQMQMQMQPLQYWNININLSWKQVLLTHCKWSPWWERSPKSQPLPNYRVVCERSRWIWIFCANATWTTKTTIQIILTTLILFKKNK